MKTIIAISSLIFIFGAASARDLSCPADKPQSSSNSEYTSSSFMLDSLQASSEKTPFKDFPYLRERVKQKVMDMQESACDQQD